MYQVCLGAAIAGVIMFIFHFAVYVRIIDSK